MRGASVLSHGPCAAAHGWLPSNGGNLSNQRYAPLTEINRDNVARL
jgi:glucose dehydrogenase